MEGVRGNLVQVVMSGSVWNPLVHWYLLVPLPCRGESWGERAGRVLNEER